MNEKIGKVLLIFITIVAAVIGIFELNQPLIAESDAYSRVNVALDQQKHGLHFNQYGGTWLPLHFTMMTYLIDIFHQPGLVSRALSLALSLATIIVVYFYSQTLYKKTHVSILAALLFAIFPLRFYLANQPLSETVFVFFFLTSLVPLLNKKSTWMSLVVSLLMLNIAHGVRYESWFALPLIFFLVITKKIPLKQKAFYILFSMAFPICWIYLNQLHRGSALTFFNEKYEVAQRYVQPEYFNLRLSFLAWWRKLKVVFPLSYLILYLLESARLIKKPTVKKAFFLALPGFLFAVLVAQVFLGTMEWFPSRYLLIPTALVTPLVANMSLNMFGMAKQFFSQQQFFYRIGGALLVGIVVAFFAKDFMRNWETTRQEVTERAMLNGALISHGTIYQSYLELTKACRNLCPEQILFYFAKDRRSYLDQAVFYTLEKRGWDIDKNIFFEITGPYGQMVNELEPSPEQSVTYDLVVIKKQPFIWEKEPVALKFDQNRFNIHFENNHFYILSLK